MALLRMLVAVCLLGVLGTAARPAAGQCRIAPTNGHPYDGEWSLLFTISPGPGESQNIQGVSVKKSFLVNEDGSFSWEQRDSGFYHQSGDAGGGPYRDDHELLLRVQGQATEQPPPRGQELKLLLDWTWGTGTHTGPSGQTDYRLSRDGKQKTGFIHRGGVTWSFPANYISQPWDLHSKPGKPDSVQLDRDGVETVTYTAARNYTVAGLAARETLVVVRRRRLRSDLAVVIVPVNPPTTVKNSFPVGQGGTFEFDVHVTNCGPHHCPNARLEVLFNSFGSTGRLSWERPSGEGRILEVTDDSLRDAFPIAVNRTVKRHCHLTDVQPVTPSNSHQLDPLLVDAFGKAFEDARNKSRRDGKRRALEGGIIAAIVRYELDDHQEDNDTSVSFSIVPSIR